MLNPKISDFVDFASNTSAGETSPVFLETTKIFSGIALIIASKEPCVSALIITDNVASSNLFLSINSSSAGFLLSIDNSDFL